MRSVFSIAALLLVAFSTHTALGQDDFARLMSEYKPVADQIIDSAREENDSWLKLQELCDDIGHRLSGSPGLEKAIDWAVQSLQDCCCRVKTARVILQVALEQGHDEGGSAPAAADIGDGNGEAAVVEREYITVAGIAGTGTEAQASLVEMRGLTRQHALAGLVPHGQLGPQGQALGDVLGVAGTHLVLAHRTATAC